MRAFIRGVLLSILLASGTASAASSVESVIVGDARVDINSSNQTLTVYVAGKRKQTFDFVAGQVYVHNADGAIVNFASLRAVVLEYAGGNQTKADIIYDELHRMALPAMGRRIQSAMLYDPYPCDLSPCPDWTPTIVNKWYAPAWVPQWNNNHTTDPGEPTPLEDYDFNRWESWRDGQCAIAHGGAQAAAVTGGAIVTLATCAGAETGVLLAACVGSGILLTDIIARGREADQNCHSEYPGFGEW